MKLLETATLQVCVLYIRKIEYIVLIVPLTYWMKLEKHCSNDVFGTDCRLVVLVFDAIISTNDVVKRKFGSSFALKLLKDWIQMCLFKLNEEVIAELSR